MNLQLHKKDIELKDYCVVIEKQKNKLRLSRNSFEKAEVGYISSINGT
tara:strand:- start:318 stop:461 length:144 start_codon:yes stop_codon:yes gene_type:complete